MRGHGTKSVNLLDSRGNVTYAVRERFVTLLAFKISDLFREG
jgi:hypothetical protein